MNCGGRGRICFTFPSWDQSSSREMHQRCTRWWRFLSLCLRWKIQVRVQEKVVHSNYYLLLFPSDLFPTCTSLPHLIMFLHVSALLTSLTVSGMFNEVTQKKINSIFDYIPPTILFSQQQVSCVWRRLVVSACVTTVAYCLCHCAHEADFGYRRLVGVSHSSWKPADRLLRL